MGKNVSQLEHTWGQKNSNFRLCGLDLCGQEIFSVHLRGCPYDPFLTLSRPIGHCDCLGDLLLYPLLRQTKLIYRKELGFELKFIALPTSPKQN